MLKSISIDILLHNVIKKEPRKTKWAVSWSWFFPTRKRCSTNGPTLDFHKSEELDFISMVVAESTNHRVTFFFPKLPLLIVGYLPYCIQLKLLISKCCSHNPSSPANACLTSFMRIWSFITTVYRNSAN